MEKIYNHFGKVHILQFNFAMDGTRITIILSKQCILFYLQWQGHVSVHVLSWYYSLTFR